MNDCYKYSDNKVHVNYDNINKNIKIAQQYNNKKIIAVVKNDAYNLGLEKVVETCLQSDVTAFAVANLDEALRIRTINNDAIVLILNPLFEDELVVAYSKNFHLVISNFDQVKMYQSFLQNNLSTTGSLKFHIKFNCGMNRFGFVSDDLEDIRTNILSNTLVAENIVGLMTHYPQSDEDDLVVHDVQVEKFINAYNTLKQSFNFEFVHSENTAAFLHKYDTLDFCNYARIGILLFGYKSMEHSLELYPTMFLYNRVVAIRDVSMGDYLGYGENNKVTKDTRVAICPLGYGDGVIGERNKYPVYINGKFYNILNNISMSHTYIEVDKDVKVGDLVEYYGENIRFDQINGVTNSRMMCALKH